MIPTPEDKTIDAGPAASMLLDLTHEVMLAAPPRTWPQSHHQLGSRHWLQRTLSVASRVNGHLLPYRVTSPRRADALDALERLVRATQASGTWGEAPSKGRRVFSEYLEAAAPDLLSPALLKVARTGQLPFSPAEMQRLRRRARAV